jgi:hypothetical protein
MKKIIVIMLVALFITSLTAEAQTKNKNTTIQTDTLAKDEIYTCTMHQNVISKKPGKCPVCGMNLEKQKMTALQKKMWKEGTYIKPKE